ncbi:hypothetical protein RESH_01938 [Rhodopirellula europaea SH398]|uniref:Uncharacterized protein n=1 Tax=Rhodopirellula europaea SH398 TaxID=1263868 RepID=M5S7U2_9BACT|nr:hypothetical protein RESH_01938 [Rhodopirellula europaea SH398]
MIAGVSERFPRTGQETCVREKCIVIFKEKEFCQAATMIQPSENSTGQCGVPEMFCDI